MAAFARIRVDNPTLWTRGSEELALAVTRAAAESLGVAEGVITVVGLEREAFGWTVLCADHTASGVPVGTNPVTVLHHLAAGRVLPHLRTTVSQHSRAPDTIHEAQLQFRS